MTAHALTTYREADHRHRHHGRARGFQVATGAAVIGFAVLTALALGAPYFTIDLTLTRAIQAFTPGWVGALATGVGWIGFPPQSNVIFGAIILGLFLAGLRWAAACTLVAAAGSAGLWFLVAPLVNRPRPSPDLVNVDQVIPYGSFPSGHVLNLTATFGFLAFIAFTYLHGRWPRWPVTAACLVPALLIGYARVYVGAHWPSDVLGGYLLGSVWLSVSIHVYRFGATRIHRTEPASTLPPSHAPPLGS